jgi:phosphotransferase system enzyme I (PtsI)
VELIAMDLSSPASTTAAPTANRLAGVGVSPGVARGPVVRMGDPLVTPPDEPSRLAVADEVATVRAAIAGVTADLRACAEAAADESVRAVLDAQALMAEDPAMADDALRRITEGATAARAVWDAFEEFRRSLLAAGGYLAERVTDLEDVRNRIVAHCLGVALPQVPDPGYPYVLTARTLSPADTAALRADQVLAIVTVEGSATSHTAILARALRIPAVVGCAGALELADGVRVVVDGHLGHVVTEAADAEDAEPAGPRATSTVAASAATTTAHRRRGAGATVAVMANVGSPDEAAHAAAAGADGIGLLRTEFLYLRAGAPPSTADHDAALRTVLAAFPGKPVTVRLIDAGGDKPLPFLATSDEPNPALGLRGLRALRLHEQILSDQLDGIARAAVASSALVSVMAPMVTDARDARWFATRVRAHPGWPPDIAVGVMVETPAAALTAGPVLAACDFASIGTNDLTQYVMAADRSLGALSALQSPWHPAVLALVAATADAGRRLGKPVGVCGEAAADPLLALVLVGLGVTSLSMTWTALATVRAALNEHSLDECAALAAAALAADDADDARERVRTSARP